MPWLRTLLLGFLLVEIASADILPIKHGLDLVAAARAGDATLVFSCKGFNVAGCNSSAINTTASGSFETSSPYAIILTPATHSAGAAWYRARQNIANGWTSDFTFQTGRGGLGITFCVQNTNSATNPKAYGTSLSSDANGLGYGAYESIDQPAVVNSIAVKFDNSQLNGQSWLAYKPSSTGLYMNGGPDMGVAGFSPADDMAPYSVVPATGHDISVHLVYDGSYLTMVAKDEVTGAQLREVWPIDIAAVIGSSSAWVGLTGGTVTSAIQRILSWDFYEGYDARLITPAISPPAGRYSTAQRVTIACPSGAKCYYTTNGRLPTTSSLLYTGPVTVSSNEIVSAIAAESGFTDSNVAQSNYQIQPSGPEIDFPGGFAGATHLILVNGMARFNGSDIQLSDGINHPGTSGSSGSAWYAVPVSVKGFTSSFALQLPKSRRSGDGLTFVIQNYLPASRDEDGRNSPLAVSGGPNAIGFSQNGFGYGGILSSVALGFDLYGTGGGNVCYVYLAQDGVNPGRGIGLSTHPVSCHNGDPLDVSLTYDSATTRLSIVMKDTTTNQTFSHNWTIDIPSVVGGDSAYVGFTAGTGYGGVYSVMDITNWTM